MKISKNVEKRKFQDIMKMKYDKLSEKMKNGISIVNRLAYAYAYAEY
jgi:hypothetical protein